MNATITFSRKIRRTGRRLLVALAVLAASAGIAVGSAGPSHAATGYLYQGTYSINSYYGWSSGWAYIPHNTQHYVSVAGYHRDVRADGYCSVVQMRGIYGSGAVTGWRKVGNNCSTTTNNYSSSTITAPSGTWFKGAQVRVCMSDRYGNAVGTCSGAVSANNWRVVSYQY